MQEQEIRAAASQLFGIADQTWQALRRGAIQTPMTKPVQQSP